MTLADFYKYSWFSNMAYVLWDEENTNDSESMRNAANAARRVPGDPSSPTRTLGDFIFDENQQNWTIPSFQANDDFGFAANLFVNESTGEKVLAIRGTEFDASLLPVVFIILCHFLKLSETGDDNDPKRYSI